MFFNNPNLIHLVDEDLQRQILRMKEYEDESIESIAEKLDMQPATVRVNLSRARKQVRMCYLKQKER